MSKAEVLWLYNNVTLPPPLLHGWTRVIIPRAARGPCYLIVHICLYWAFAKNKWHCHFPWEDSLTNTDVEESRAVFVSLM